MTEEHPTLREFIERVIEERHLLYASRLNAIEARIAAQRDFFEAKIGARDKADSERNDVNLRSLEVARQELRSWQGSHNDLQNQLKNQQGTYITRQDLVTTTKKIEAVERLVYIAVGLAIAAQIIFAIILKPH